MTDLIPAPVALAFGAALFQHECGSDADVAYRLSYAKIGRSGGSFGRYQADCHANPLALKTLAQILANAKVPMATRGRIIGALKNPAPSNPLSVADLKIVDAAIDSTQGRVLVDALDATILAGVLDHLDRCILYASAHGSAIEPPALFGMGLWINASGAPTDLLRWLAGDQIELGGEPVPLLARGAAVDQAAWLTYYERIPFVRKYPTQVPAILSAIAVGMRALGPESPPPAAGAGSEQSSPTDDQENTLSAPESVTASTSHTQADALNDNELRSVESAA